MTQRYTFILMCTNDTIFFSYICPMHKKVDFNKLDFEEQFVPGQSIDCVIIGFENHKIKILVLKWKAVQNAWALPGGFIRKDEDLDKAAIRILKERTGVELPFLEQFKTFGNLDRNKSKYQLENSILESMPSAALEWLNQRFISTGYVSLVDISKCSPKPDIFSEKIAWVDLEELPELIMDHDLMVKTAIGYIKNQINYLPIGINLLPEKFTMKQLQLLYEAILSRKLDRGNFQRKMLKLDIFIRHEKRLEGGANKAPYLYSFDEEKYNELLKQGFGFSS